MADFVGKVNVMAARRVGGELHVGELRLPSQGEDREVRVYMRPEDVLARPIGEGDPHVFDARIEKIDFLGSHCHVHVSAPLLEQQRLVVYLSLNFLAEQALQVGSSLPLKLLPERMRVF